VVGAAIVDVTLTKDKAHSPNPTSDILCTLAIVVSKTSLVKEKLRYVGAYIESSEVERSRSLVSKTIGDVFDRGFRDFRQGIKEN